MVLLSTVSQRVIIVVGQFPVQAMLTVTVIQTIAVDITCAGD
jgi:hypothetical protein